MRKKLLTALLISAMLISACGTGGSEKKPSETSDRRVPELIRTVPSDAIAVVCYDRSSEGMRLYDSTSVLHRLDLSGFSTSDMVLSLSYNGSLAPVLAIEAGKSEADSLSAVSALIADARSNRLQAELVSAEQTGSRGGAVVITTSEAEMAAVRRHLGESTSILDAQGFREALNRSGNASSFTILKTAGADRFLPKDFLAGTFRQRDVADFVKTICEWVTVVPSGDGFNAVPVCGDSDTWFANAMEAMPAGESHAGTVLPASTRFAIAMPVEVGGFREAYERYLDARVRIERYRKDISALSKSTGKDPLKWEKEVGVREVALARWEGHSVLLVRPGKKVADRHPEENAYRGFIPALYGAAFGAVDDSFSAASGGWYIYGTESDVTEFILCDTRMEEKAWPGTACHCIIYEPEKGLVWNKKVIRIWNSNL